MDIQSLQAHLHGMFVHFPIALLLSSVFMEFLALHRPWRERLRAASGITLLLGVIGAGLAVLTGPEDTADLLPMGRIHEAMAQGSTILFGLLLVWRALAYWKRRTFEKSRLAVYLAAAAIGVVMLGYTGYLGGTMVYEQGAGVQVNGQLVAPATAGRH
jgi:uncharacterized membrane protein